MRLGVVRVGDRFYNSILIVLMLSNIASKSDQHFYVEPLGTITTLRVVHCFCDVPHTTKSA